MEDVNERLRKAARRGYEAELKALLMDSGCDALATDSPGWTALMHAAYGGHEACVRILLPISDVPAKTKNGQTALMWAAGYGYVDCVRLLLPMSDVQAKDGRGRTALMWGACYGHEGCVRLLLPVSDVQAKDESGQTASSWARIGGYESLGIFIEAYELSQSERDFIGAAAGSGASSKKSKIRV